MKLNLKNSLVVFDLETTGLNIAKDRIVEIAVLKISPNGDEEIRVRRVNPGIPISPEAMAIHGITNEDVKDEVAFKQIAKSLAQFIDGCDFAGYNLMRFDVPLLNEEFLRAGVDFDFRKRKIVDVQTIFYKMEPRTLSGAYRFYCNKELVEAHSAEQDTRATYEVLLGQLNRYDSLENDINFLSKFTTRNDNIDYAGRLIKNEKGEAIVNFGKYRGRPLVEVFKNDPNYYDWMMNGEFTQDTKKQLTELFIRFKQEES